MARDLLFIPATASDAERLFSAAKLTVTDQRGRMCEETLKLLQHLKSWNRSSIFGNVGLSSDSVNKPSTDRFEADRNDLHVHRDPWPSDGDRLSPEVSHAGSHRRVQDVAGGSEQ